ncbi:MAG: hypothetical protein ACYTFG_02350 [Planctomycetota bacterium]|jgi:hypothetical protein
MKGWILAIVIAAALTGALIHSQRPPNLEEARVKHAMAQAILSGLLKGMSEWEEEAKKLRTEEDALFERYKVTIARNDGLVKAHRFAKAPGVIAEMEKALAAEIVDMKIDISALKTDQAGYVRRMGILQAEAEHASPERAAALRVQIDQIREERDNMGRLLEEAAEDLKRARNVLRG